MKKTVAILLALCLLFALSGCVSQSDVDAAAAQRDALQAELDALQEQYDALQARLEPHSQYIQPLMEEEYDVVLEILEEKQADKEKSAAEMIEPYLVTVELTPENFLDYFEMKAQVVSGDQGEDTLVCFLASKVYEQGLILYKSDAAIGVVLAMEHNGHSYFDQSTDMVFDYGRLYMARSSSGAPTIHGGAITGISGTVTFVKADAVTGYEVTDGDTIYEYEDTYLVSLINGESLVRRVYFGEKF